MNLEVSMSTLSERKYVYTRPLILAVDLRHTFEGGGYRPTDILHIHRVIKKEGEENICIYIQKHLRHKNISYFSKFLSI